jgi:hypothetical protein
MLSSRSLFFFGCLISVSLAASVFEERPVAPVTGEKTPFSSSSSRVDFSSFLKQFDMDAFTQKLPKDLLQGIPEDLLEQSKAALKEGKIDFQALAEKVDSSLDTEGNDELSKKVANLIGISVEEFKERQEKTRKVLEEAKRGDGKVDWSELFSFNAGFNGDEEDFEL